MNFFNKGAELFPHSVNIGQETLPFRDVDTFCLRLSMVLKTGLLRKKKVFTLHSFQRFL